MKTFGPSDYHCGHAWERDGLDIAWPLKHAPGYIDPASGLTWSRGLNANLKARASFYAKANTSASVRRQLLKICAQSFAFWRDHFVWSVHDQTWGHSGQSIETEGRNKTAPFIGWPIHDVLHAAAGLADKHRRIIVVPKSRETMVTWHFLCESLWIWGFRLSQKLLYVAEKEDKVDGAGTDRLFPRMRFVIEHLPEWMRPANWDKYTSHMNLFNPVTGSNIDGDTTTNNIGRGQRPKRIMFEEAGHIAPLQEMLNATDGSATGCRVLISTPNGPGAFRDNVHKPSRIVVAVGYWCHPAKGTDRIWSIDKSGTITGEQGRGYWDSSYLRYELQERGTELASIKQNELIDFGGTSMTVFNPNKLMTLLAVARQNPPLLTGSLVHSKSGHDRDESLRRREVKMMSFEPTHPQLKLWCSLVNGRPPQKARYVMGCDVSNGLSASNSVITILDVSRLQRVGTWTSSQTDPAELARVLVMLSLWFGGEGDAAMIAWERNGPGGIVSKYVAELRPPQAWRDSDGQMGWVSSRLTKRALVEHYANALNTGKLTDWDDGVLQECSDWVYKGEGWVGPAVLAQDTDARATHGDRVVASMLAWWLCDAASVARPLPKRPREFEDELIDEQNGKNRDEYSAA